MTTAGVFHLACPVPDALAQAPSLLGQVPGLLAQARGPQSPQVDVGSMLLMLGIASVVIGGVSLGIFFAHRASVKRQKDSHPGLFNALCKVHNLDRGQKSLLSQVVRARNTTYPAQVFTEPKWTNPKSLPASLAGKAADVAKLHQALFN
ncbi:MAG: hypothetical protein U1E05_25615 [Patescibacteria group bacterium]|nr:hypothetical protein [Patescibacteria group bacterium]